MEGQYKTHCFLLIISFYNLAWGAIKMLTEYLIFSYDSRTVLSLSISQQPPLVKNPSAMTATSNLIYYKYIALSFCGCYGFEVQLWHSTRQRGQRTTAGRTIGAFHSGVSSNCHIRTTAELNRYDGFQIPNSSQIVNLALCSTMLPDS